MTSRFTGRDYSSLRTEIIDFLRQRLPNGWDYTNLADPVVIFAESLARIGDQLHFTIDELRRECDVATARRASSIYSYAMREGYKMMLPNGSYGTIKLNSKANYSGHLTFKIKKFDELQVNSTGDRLYVVNDIPEKVNSQDDRTIDLYSPVDDSYLEVLSNYYLLDENGNPKYDVNGLRAIDFDKRSDYEKYVAAVYEKTPHINVVLGKKAEFAFTFGDINNDSTVDLPDPIIDRNLVRLRKRDSVNSVLEELRYVDDIISTGYMIDSYTLTPKFIGGSIVLSIEFPTNYRDLFSPTSSFVFEYIKITNNKIEGTVENASSIDWSNYVSLKEGYALDDADSDINDAVLADLGNGILGYREYEDALTTRENYKKFVQDYSALLTKSDYTNYIKATSTTNCKVFDHDDNYKEDSGLPPGTVLLPRVLYILTDGNYSTRSSLWRDLKERSSRSDCIVMIPYGKDPYSIVVKADCYLLGTSMADVTASIKSELLQYYSDVLGEKIPEKSMINYLVHKASDKVIRTDSVVVRDSTFGTLNSDFSDVINLSNDDIDYLFDCILNETISSDPNDTSLSTKYLRGEVEGSVDLSGNSANAILYYNKYPRVVGDGCDRNVDDNDFLEYQVYPRKFPDIYNFKLETVCRSYDELVENQVNYGIYDTQDIDYSDDEIFKPKTTGHVETDITATSASTSQGEYISDEFEITPVHGVTHTYISTDYVDHHYMRPFLNRVIILIKAITK